jgi:cell division protein FtsB
LSNPTGPRSSRWPTRRLLGMLPLLVAVYYAVWGGEYSVFDLHRIDRQKQTESNRIEAARLEVDSLRDLASRLESDPATIEAVARERFGLIRPGEVLYRFVEVDSSEVQGARAVQTAASPRPSRRLDYI